MKIQTFANPSQVTWEALHKDGPPDPKRENDEKTIMVSGTPYRISFTSDNLVVTRQANCLQRAFGRDYSAQIAKNLQEEYSTYREVKSALNGLEEIVPLATENRTCVPPLKWGYRSIGRICPFIKSKIIQSAQGLVVV
jgi:hypothetical protein